MATAVTRRAKRTGKSIHPEESLFREQAIRFYTINNARVLGCEDRLGSLEPGKLADLVVLDTDLLTCPEERIAATQAVQTYLADGRPINAGTWRDPDDAHTCLPSDWTEEPPPPSTKELGDRWVKKSRSAILELPSAIIPAEPNYQLNPAHPGFKKVLIGKPVPVAFDPRLL